jgi:hypothetical protein
MLRSTFSFLSLLAAGIFAAAIIVMLPPALLPFATVGEGGKAAIGDLQFASVVVGVALGLALGTMSRYPWADVPRRLVSWVLIRERQLFWAALLVAGLVILFLY